jgi:beta-mannosidase
MAHGGYLFLSPEGIEVYQVMNDARATAYTEFGCASTPSVSELHRFVPPNELFPPKERTAWEVHNAFNAWRAESWLSLPTIERYFGKSQSVEELVGNSQILQAEAYKYIFEEARRQKPRCSMAINWCLNEPWPTAANNSIISYYGIMKPAYYTIKEACRPILCSARIKKHVWQSEEVFETELWLLNDHFESVESGTVTAVISIGKKEYDMLTWSWEALPPNTNCQGPTARLILPCVDDDKFTLILRCDNTLLDSRYTLCYKKNDTNLYAHRLLNQ